MNPPQTAYTCAVVIMILGKPTSLPHRHTFSSRQDLSQRPSVVCCFTPRSGSWYRSPENTHRNRTVNKTRPTRFPHSNYHAKTIFPENDFSSVLGLLCLELSLLFSPWLVGFFSINFPHNHLVAVGWIPLRSRFASRISTAMPTAEIASFASAAAQSINLILARLFSHNALCLPMHLGSAHNSAHN